MCSRLQPDVITMDIRMPVMDGYKAIQHIMAESPRPIVVCTTTVSDKEMKISFKAIEAGALVVIGKPGGLPGEDLAANELITTVKAMAGVKVIRRRRWLQENHKPLKTPLNIDLKVNEDIKLIAIGASTGGPPAIHQILCRPGNILPVPIIVVQHITPGFVVGLARWLDETSPYQVTVAEDGEYLKPGHVYLAPDNNHLEVAGPNRILLKTSAPLNRHRPSVSMMFESVARVLGDKAVGVLLTGMGEDGASGLLAMYKANAYTIAQDRASCIVFGMPKVAVALGAAREVCPLDQIGPRLNFLLSKNESGFSRSKS